MNFPGGCGRTVNLAVPFLNVYLNMAYHREKSRLQVCLLSLPNDQSPTQNLLGIPARLEHPFHQLIDFRTHVTQVFVDVLTESPGHYVLKTGFVISRHEDHTRLIEYDDFILQSQFVDEANIEHLQRHLLDRVIHVSHSYVSSAYTDRHFDTLSKCSSSKEAQ